MPGLLEEAELVLEPIQERARLMLHQLGEPARADVGIDDAVQRPERVQQGEHQVTVRLQQQRRQPADHFLRLERAVPARATGSAVSLSSVPRNAARVK